MHDPGRSADPQRDAAFGKLKSLTRHSAIYGVFDVLGRASALVLVPLYTGALGPTDYGILELYLVTQGLLLLLVSLGFPTALTKYWITSGTERRAEYFPSGLGTVLVTAGAACGLLWALAPAIARWEWAGGSPLLIRLVAATVFADAASTLCLALFRAQERSLRYSLVNLAKLLMALGLNVWLVAFLHLGIRGVLLGNLAAAATAGAAALILARRELSPRISREAVRTLAAFGLPLALAGCAMFVLNNADRYFLRAMAPPADLGLYALAYKIGIVMSLAVNGFLLAWPPALFQIAKLPDAPDTLRRVPTYFLLVYAPLFLVLTGLSRELVAVAGTEEFAGAARLVGPIVASYVMSGLFYVFCMGSVLTNRTRIVPGIVFSAAGVNTAANLLLIPRYGAMGAAWATVIAFLVLVAVAYALNQRFYRAPLEWRRVVSIVALTAVILAAMEQVPGAGIGPAAARLGVVLLLYPAGLGALRLLDAEEWFRVRRLLLRAIGR